MVVPFQTSRVGREMLTRCTCGSGRYADPNYDGYGIFLCYTCTRCHEKRMARYRADINERYDTDEQIEPDE